MFVSDLGWLQPSPCLYLHLPLVAESWREGISSCLTRLPCCCPLPVYSLLGAGSPRQGQTVDETGAGQTPCHLQVGGGLAKCIGVFLAATGLGSPLNRVVCPVWTRNGQPVVTARSVTILFQTQQLLSCFRPNTLKEKQVRNPCVYSRPGDRVWP